MILRLLSLFEHCGASGFRPQRRWHFDQPGGCRKASQREHEPSDTFWFRCEVVVQNLKQPYKLVSLRLTQGS